MIQALKDAWRARFGVSASNEAKRAVIEARQALQDSASRQVEVRNVCQGLEEYRESNHFASLIRRAMEQAVGA